LDCKLSFDALIKLAHNQHQHRQLVLEQFYELGTGIPENAFLKNEISIKAIDELFVTSQKLMAR